MERVNDLTKGIYVRFSFREYLEELDKGIEEGNKFIEKQAKKIAGVK